jgi:hypothetical protein
MVSERARESGQAYANLTAENAARAVAPLAAA